MGGFIVEFWSFLRVRKKFWLVPMTMSMVVASPVLRVTQGTRYRAIRKLQRHSQTAELRLDAQRKIAIAEAVIAEAQDDPAFEAHIKAIVRKRVIRPFDVTVMAEWRSTT